jgi:hypothetical protein
MLTTDAAWAAGYAVKFAPNWHKNVEEESPSGAVHVVELQTTNNFKVSGSLHDTESHLIRLADALPSSGHTLTTAARAVHAEFGYEALLANFRGEIVGAIILVDVPVARTLDPVDVLQQSYPRIADNLKAMLQRLGKLPPAFEVV